MFSRDMVSITPQACGRYKLSSRILPLLAALGLSIGLSAPASAETGASSRSTGQEENHCVSGVESQSLECFSSFRAAIAAATGGRVQDAPTDAQAAALDDGFTAKLDGLSATSAPDVVIGIEYEHSGYRGSSLIASAPYGCDDSADADWQYSSMPSGWNDRISSYRVYNNCLVDHWEHVNFVGSHTGLNGTRSYIGDAMNDRTSSIRWH